MVNGNTKKDTIRLSVTISRELHTILKDLSECTGKSLAHMPAYVLEESKPTFLALIKAYSTAKNDKQKALDEITEHAEQAMVKAAGIITHD
jgi:hypothetical protein|tara:strand:- start:1090 stop:1362 length:273 start_codon:yes stop_codon:yes gene_type:complete